MRDTAKALSRKLIEQGEAKDMREYQELKTAEEMEIDATRRLYEHLKRQHGDTVARQMMRSKGYNVELLR